MFTRRIHPYEVPALILADVARAERFDSFKPQSHATALTDMANRADYARRLHNRQGVQDVLDEWTTYRSEAVSFVNPWLIYLNQSPFRRPHRKYALR